MKNGICPSCNSHDVIPGISLVDHGHGTSIHDLSVEIFEKPQALFLKGAQARSALHAWICGTCGYTELYADAPKELLAIYRRYKAQHS